ncbi:MAG: hypothetical protein AAGG07_02440 [Planctomycetota bacterium]
MPTDVRELDRVPPMPRDATASLAWMHGLAVVLSLGLCGLGGATGQPTVVALGVLGLILVCVIAPITFAWASRRGDAKQMHQLVQKIEELAEHQALSDDARRVVNRKRERDLLRRAIEEDLRSGDHDAAMVLVQELAERFGYRADAEEFRRRVEEARSDDVERRVSGAVSELDGLIDRKQWAEAYAEAARVTRLFPGAMGTEGLRHRVEQARADYKRSLERRFLQAAGEQRSDEAMALLTELDQYLSEREAQPLKEVARGVISQARDNLGVRFKLAVQDKQWGVAAEVGERIIEQFPNSRMAEEVRSLIDGVRDRAGVL